VAERGVILPPVEQRRTGMPEYRIYPIARDGTIFGVSEGEYGDDAMAMAAARAMTQIGSEAEVWERDRRIGKICGAGPGVSL
jgi:hypothetical protein